ncbi:hypothetical protein MBANPS3_005290 [Mucor bainieri]
MEGETPLYGIDKEIQAKIDSKYSVEREQQARQWMEELIGEKFPSDDFAESLKDGVILCKVIGKLVPGQGKFKQSKMPFIQMENISIFLRGAEALGVPKYDLFQTVDLFEKKNMTQVIDSIFSLSRYGYKAGTSPNLSRNWGLEIDIYLLQQYLGPKLADKQKPTYSQDAANAANATFNTYQYGYTGGANQSGMSFGQRRNIAVSLLNEELLLYTFSQLDSVNQLAACRLVCKAWSGPAMREMLGRRIHIKSESKAIKLYKYLLMNPAHSGYIKQVHFSLENAALPLVIAELLPMLITPNICKLTGIVKSDIFFNALFRIVDNKQLDKLTTLPAYGGRDTRIGFERILRLKSTTISLKITLSNFAASAMWSFVRQLHQFPKLTTLELKGYVRNLIELETVLKKCTRLVTLIIADDFEFKELPANGMQIRDLRLWLNENAIAKIFSLKTLKVQSTCRPEFVEYLTYKYPNINHFTFEGKLWHPDGSIAICNGNLDRILNATARIPHKQMTLILPSQTRMRDAFHFSKGRLEHITYDLKEIQGKDKLVMVLRDDH